MPQARQIAAAAFAFVLLLPPAATRVAADPRDEITMVSEYASWRVSDKGDKAELHTELEYAVLAPGTAAEGLRDVVLTRSYLQTPRRGTFEVRDATGVRFSRNLGDMLETPYYSDTAFISDSKALSLHLPPLAAGDTVSIRYEVEMKPFIGFPVVTLGNLRIPTGRSVFQVEAPARLEPRFRAFHGAGDPEDKSDGDAVIWRWELHHIPALADEPHGPSPAQALPCVSLGLNRVAWGPAGTWEEIAETYWEHAADRVTDMADTRVTGRTPGLNSEFACRLDQVQAGVRYVAIALGPGGWIPHAAGDVLNRGFGDCKDMSTLLLSLLGGPRSQASLALVLTSPPAAADVDPLPSLALFNHAVVCASGNNGDVWLDATDRHATMTSPRADIQGSPALVVSGAGRGYRRIPRAEPDRNRVERSIGIRPGVSGSWQLHATIRFQGTPRSDFLHTLEKLDLEDRDHRRNTLAWVLGLTEADLIYGPTTIDVDHTDPDVLSLKLLAKVTGMDAGTGGGMRLKAAWSPEPEPFDLFQARSRESDVYWPALGVVVDTLTVHARPVPDLVDTTWSSSVEGIAVSASRRVEPNRVVLAREVRVEEPVFPAAAWKEARSLRNRVRRWSSTVIPIVSPQ